MNKRVNKKVRVCKFCGKTFEYNLDWKKACLECIPRDKDYKTEYDKLRYKERMKEENSQKKCSICGEEFITNDDRKKICNSCIPKDLSTREKNNLRYKLYYKRRIR